MPNTVISQVRGTLTMGGADAFISSTINTNIDTTGTIFAWLLRRFELGWASATANHPLLGGVDATCRWGITRDLTISSDASTGALPSSASLVFRDGFVSNTVGTATSNQVVPDTHIYVFPEGTLIADPQLLVFLDATSTGVTAIAYWRLYYEMVKISEGDYIRLIRGFY